MLRPGAVDVAPDHEAGIVEAVCGRARRAGEIETAVGAVDPYEAVAEGADTFLVEKNPDELPARVNIAASRPKGIWKVERAVLAGMEDVPVEGPALEGAVAAPIADNVAAVGYLPSIRSVSIGEIDASETISTEQKAVLLA